MDEKISVVITTYNRTSELERAINSVLLQTYKNIEIIVVDDNKDENVSKKVKEIIERLSDKRIKYIKNKENLGGALSRNEGIDASTGKYIAFLDDDDEYLPQKIEKQYKCFKNSAEENLALVYCYCKGVKDGRTIKEYKYNYTGNCLAQVMKGCIAATSQWMCKKECLNKVGNFTNVPCKQDSTLLVKLLLEGYSVDRVPEILSLYHEENIPRISDNNAKKRIDGVTRLLELCRKNYDKVSSKDVKEIEYEFARELIVYYYMLGDKENYKKCLNIINNTNFFGIRTIDIKINILKKRIKKLLKK